MEQSRPAPAFSRRRLLGGLALASFLPAPLVACGGGEPGYYTLTTSAGTAAAGAPATVEVRTPSIASYLERDSIVRSDNDGKLSLAADSAWASSLSDMIGRTLVVDLSQRLPGSSVYGQGDATSTQPLAIVALDISSFSSDGENGASLAGSLSVYRPGEGPAGSMPLALSRQIYGSGMTSLVATLSLLVGEVADMAADELRRLPPSPAPA